jgi:23S rRNA (adenine2030-N6)-methyltransferase
MLNYLTQKDKPLSYIESHAGRGLYDLGDEAALKTGEAAAGIDIAEGWFPAAHPYAQRLAETRSLYGPSAYPGSPMIAALGLRETDTIHLAELHPQEHAALKENLGPSGAHIQKRDGLEMALALCPPTPRRGMLLIDPSYEVKDDYVNIPKVMGQIARKWNVGLQALWYPILQTGAHLAMRETLQAMFADGFCHELRFPAVREGHKMIGTGMFIVNAPYGIETEAARLTACFPR